MTCCNLTQLLEQQKANTHKKKRGETLTYGLQDQGVGCHSLSVKIHYCSDHSISEANAEFAILVSTCRRREQNNFKGEKNKGTNKVKNKPSNGDLSNVLC